MYLRPPWGRTVDDATTRGPGGEGTPRRTVAPSGVLRRGARLAERLALALGGLFAFVFGILMMKQTAGVFSQTFPSFILTVGSDPWKALGFGWGAAYLVLSGSPIAALSLGLLDGGAVTPNTAYAMIMGSRLGAAILTVVLGLMAWLARGQDRYKSLAIGILSFVVTYTIYAPAILLGYALMTSGSVGWLTFQAPGVILQAVAFFVDPLVKATLAVIPTQQRLAAFLLAFGAIYVGFYLFDGAFYREEVEEIKRSRIHALLRKPIYSFLLGAVITLVAESVSLSLGILVPLFLRGQIDEEDVIPYVMGANITTFIDTLLAALLLENSAGVNVVILEILSVAAVSALALKFYRAYHALVIHIYDFVMNHDVALVTFVAGLVAAPVLILFLL